MSWHICWMRTLVWHSRNWVSAKWQGSESNSPNLKVPEGSGKGNYLPLGQVPGPWFLWNRPGCLLTLLQWFGGRVAWLLSQPSPQLCRGLWPPWMGCCQQLAVGCCPCVLPASGSEQSPQNWVVGTGLGGRCGLVQHKALGWRSWCFCLCSGPYSCGSRLAFTAGCRQGIPLGGPCCFGCGSSRTLGGWPQWTMVRLFPSIWMVPWSMKTSPSVKMMSGSIAHQSSCTLLAMKWGWLGTGGCTPWPNAAEPLQRWWCCSWARRMSWVPNLASLGSRWCLPMEKCAGSCAW